MNPVFLLPLILDSLFVIRHPKLLLPDNRIHPPSRKVTAGLRPAHATSLW